MLATGRIGSREESKSYVEEVARNAERQYQEGLALTQATLNATIANEARGKRSWEFDIRLGCGVTRLFRLCRFIGQRMEKRFRQVHLSTASY